MKRSAKSILLNALIPLGCMITFVGNSFELHVVDVNDPSVQPNDQLITFGVENATSQTLSSQQELTLTNDNVNESPLSCSELQAGYFTNSLDIWYNSPKCVGKGCEWAWKLTYQCDPNNQSLFTGQPTCIGTTEYGGLSAPNQCTTLIKNSGQDLYVYVSTQPFPSQSSIHSLPSAIL